MAQKTHRFSEHIKLRNAERLYGHVQVPLPADIQERYATYEFAIDSDSESDDLEDHTSTRTTRF
jgi:hypothetical protein